MKLTDEERAVCRIAAVAPSSETEQLLGIIERLAGGIEIPTADLDAMRAFLDSALSVLSGFTFKTYSRAHGQVREASLEPSNEWEEEQIAAAGRLLQRLGGPP